MTRELYTITDISEITGVHQQTLRNWEKQELIEPMRVAGNQRIYDDTHIARIKEILSLKEEGFRLKGVSKILNGTGMSNSKKKASKPTLAVAAQTLEKTNAKPKKVEDAVIEETPVVTIEEETTPTPVTVSVPQESYVRYRAEELEEMRLKDLSALAKEEGVLYFRQMLREELIIALSQPERRMEMAGQAKERTKSRYGSKSQDNEEETVVQSVQEPEEDEVEFTEDNELEDKGLVTANIEEDLQEEKSSQNILIEQILELGLTGKSSDEIARILAKSYK